MVAKKHGKGKPGVTSKGVSKVEVLGDGNEELGDPGQGGSGVRTEDRELVLDADAGLMELSAEQRAVEKATEVQEELDTVALENEALKRELRAAKEVLEKRSEKGQLMAKRAELEKRIARAGQREDEWALEGGDRREGSVLGAAGRSRSRSRGSRVESPEGRRSRLPTLPEGWVARRKRPEMRSKSRSRSRSRRVVMRSPERGAKKRTSRERSPPRRSPARRVSLRRTSSGRSSPSRASPARLSPRASPERGSLRRARSRDRARSKERKERDRSLRRISGEIAILKKQVEAQEKQRKPWIKPAHQK